MVQLKEKRPCLYCGKPTKRGKKGEHIVPDAIGGALTLNDVSDRVVCSTCNSGVLSLLDKELCSRSYLSAVASQEINAHLWQVWDVDHESDNLLVEARPLWAEDGMLKSLICYPQITFEHTGPDLRGDGEEFCRFGRDDFAKVLIKAVQHCYGRYREGLKVGHTQGLNIERVRREVLYDGQRLAPRIYTRHSIFEIARNVRKQSFVLRYVTEEDKQYVLQLLPRLSEVRKLVDWEHKPGSRYPTISFWFDVGDTMRALMKMGLNLIAAHCPNTPVNHETFAPAIRVIIDAKGQVPPRVLRQNGFVRAVDVASISASGNAHSFRLVHADGKWHVYSSFFGGKIGSYVRVPGPNLEPWRCANIVAPLKSKKWTVETSTILPVMNVRVEWEDGKAIVPSFERSNIVSAIGVGVARR